MRLFTVIHSEQRVVSATSDPKFPRSARECEWKFLGDNHSSLIGWISWHFYLIFYQTRHQYNLLGIWKCCTHTVYTHTHSRSKNTRESVDNSTTRWRL